MCGVGGLKLREWLAAAGWDSVDVFVNGPIRSVSEALGEFVVASCDNKEPRAH